MVTTGDENSPVEGGDLRGKVYQEVTLDSQKIPMARRAASKAVMVDLNYQTNLVVYQSVYAPILTCDHDQ